jgi:hypothetical protein
MQPILRYTTMVQLCINQNTNSPTPSHPKLDHVSIFAGAHLLKISIAPFLVSASTINKFLKRPYDFHISPHTTQYKLPLPVVVIKVNILLQQIPISVFRDLNRAI